MIDSSVWVKFLSRHPDEDAVHVQHLLDRSADLALTDIILTEILQGIKDDRTFRETRTYLLTFPIFRARGLETFVHAAELYRACRKAGATIRSSIDCLIAAVAIEHQLTLFHSDRDFDAIARCSSLRLYQRPQK